MRIFNTYGPRMALDDGRVVSNFVAQALMDQPLTVYGNGQQTRSFQYVSDLIRGEAGWCLSAQHLCTVPLCGLRSAMQPVVGHFQRPTMLLSPAALSNPSRTVLLNIDLQLTQSSKFLTLMLLETALQVWWP